MCRHALPLMLFLLSAAAAALAEERGGGAVSEPWRSAARTLQQATATVRIWDQSQDAAARPVMVTVCSGLCVRDGLVITAAVAGSDSPIRLTFPGGKQADAKLLVIDEYSGLALVKVDTSSLVPLAFAGSMPDVG